MNRSTAEKHLVALFRGEPLDWPKSDIDRFEEALWQEASKHGVLTLLYDSILGSSAQNSIPPHFLIRLKQNTYQSAAQEMFWKQEITYLLNLLAANDIDCLLMKGSPLAYALYPQPYLRNRCDTDIILPNKMIAETAWEILKSDGYQRPNAVGGDLISQQFSCYKSNQNGVVHAFDLHWEINNFLPFALAFNYEELKTSAIAVPALGDNALALDSVNALLLACLHRVAHKSEGTSNRLIWLYDIHLLSGILTGAEWRDFLTRSNQKSLDEACQEGLAISRQTFQTNLPRIVVDNFGLDSNHTDIETSTRTRLQNELDNIKSLNSWKQQLHFLKQHAFPTPNYMYGKYKTRNPLLLPFLYLIRVISGIRKLLSN